MIKTAMILAAGRGTRMGTLGEQTHKGLLKIGDKCLLDFQLEKLAATGIKKVVINLHYFTEQVMATLGDGSRYGLQIEYSIEKELLGTGGGIFNALPLLGQQPFILLSADVWSHYPLIELTDKINALAHLVMVDNPPGHPKGDFALDNGKLTEEGEPKYTYGSIGVLHPDLFKDCELGKFPIMQVLRPAIQAEKVTGEYYSGHLFNTNTPEEWQALQDFLLQKNML